MHDLVIECKQCGRAFVFSADKRQRYLERGLMHTPRRCAACRAAGPAFVRYNVRCDRCGTAARVPFRPRLRRPVYCRACFRHTRSLQPEETSA